jgi:type II secretory pathway pseudopilin PulG
MDNFSSRAPRLRASLVERLRRLLRRQEGMTLLMSLGTLAVLSIVGVSAASYSLAGERTARISARGSSASSLAEAGINEAMAVLAKPGNNPLNPGLLPTRTSTYETGTVTWSGSLDEATSTWNLTSAGQVRNPTQAADVTRVMTAQVPVTLPLAQNLSSPAWNFIYATATGGTCDMTIQQSVQVASPLYVTGNLCLQNTATVTSGPLDVRGQLTLYQSANSIGSASSPISEAHIGKGCLWKNNPLHNPCSSADNVFATVLDSSTPEIAPPTAYWEAWYFNASPGPYSPCLTQSGTPPTFDNDQGSLTSPDASKRNNSLSLITNLTPALSYVCKTAGGELSWDALARLLTVKGTIFIDGSAKIENGFVNAYNGQSSLYLSGTLLVRNSKLCAVVATGGSDCTASGWDPNTKMLVVAANGTGGQLPLGISVQLVSSTFQGALFGTGAIEIDTTSQAIGPLVGSTIALGQSGTTSFPSLSIVPAGAPGQAPVAASVGAPRVYGG